MPPEILAALADDDKKDDDKKEDEEVKKEVVDEKKVEIIPLEDRKVNYFKDFFARPAFLTVSG